jgi:repressor LexA
VTYYRRIGHVCDRCAAEIRGRRALTERQARLLWFIIDYYGENGFAPSFEEIAERFAYKTLATVHEHLSNLETKGWIRRQYNESRAIEVLATPFNALDSADAFPEKRSSGGSA